MDGKLTSFAYDAADNMQKIVAGGVTSGNDLWTYTYADYGKTLTKQGQYGQISQGQADGAGRLLGLTSDLPGTTQDNATSFTYGAASQIASRTVSNDAWAWTAHDDRSYAYTVNGLNQYTSGGPATFAYDANGNLTGDGTTSYTYDIENRLVTASGGTSAALRYDPLGRLYETSGGTVGTTRFLYDGDELVAEYNASGTLLRRYVHGAGIDDPMLWYEGASTTSPRWLQADHQGSIVAISTASGVLGLNSYDEYGIPAPANLGRFGYTGQIWLPELGMYYYKARIYAPTLGRFLQTDPIGYQDQVNLYAYVGNDPVNGSDPSGLAGCGDLKGDDCNEAMRVQSEALRNVSAARREIANLQRERASIKDGKQENLSKRASETKAALKSHFGSASNHTIRTLDQRLAGVQKILADDGQNYNYAKTDGSYLGQTRVWSSLIRLGSPYFAANNRNQVVTQIHEAAHIAGNHFFRPERYESRALDPSLSVSYRLYNADNVAIFSYNISH